MAYKYQFFCDYSEGAHPQILEAFSRTNTQQEEGYGMDSFANEAVDLIRNRIGKKDAAIHLYQAGHMQILLLFHPCSNLTNQLLPQTADTLALTKPEPLKPPDTK